MKSSRPFAGIGLATILSLVAPTVISAQDLGGTVRAVGGAVSGVLSGAGGTVSGAIGGSAAGSIAGSAMNAAAGGAGSAAAGLGGGIVGPGGTFSGLTPGAQPFFSSSAFGSGNAMLSAAPRSALAAAQIEERQRILGDVVSVTSATVTVRRSDRTTKTYVINGDMATVLRALVGKAVYLRSADGVHITSIVGRDDIIRGLVTAVNGPVVTFVSSNGEVHSISLSAAGIAALHLAPGQRVLSVSHDFGKTARLAVLSGTLRASLSDVFLGRVAALSKNTVTLGIAPGQEQFRIDAAMYAILSGLRGRTVALQSPDGVHVKSLLASPTLVQLVARSKSGARLQSGTIAATVLSATSGKLTLQMPNGDIVSYLGHPGHLGLHDRTAVFITPLDRLHVRIRAGAKVASFADADACVTINARCRSAMSGHVIAVSPSTLSVRLGNGDSRTYLGNLTPIGVNAGVPITIEPLDWMHARVIAGATAVQLLDAHACVTINAGCDTMQGTVVGTGPSSVTVRFADGSVSAFQGNVTPLGVTANVPVIVQPLDSTHAVVLANGKAANLADAQLCVTLNASCPAVALGTGSSGNSSSNPPGSGTIAANGCVSINGSDCVAAAGLPGGIGNAGNNGNAGYNGNAGNNGSNNGDDGLGGRAGFGGAGGPLSYMVASLPQVASEMAGSTSCAQDGQVFVHVNNLANGKTLAGARVELVGKTRPTWVSGADGTVRFLRIPTGKYHVEVTRTGYRAVRSTEFNVDCRQANSLQFRLAQNARGRSIASAPAHATRVSAASIRLVAINSTTCIGNHRYRAYTSHVHHIVRTVRRRFTTYHCTR